MCHFFACVLFFLTCRGNKTLAASATKEPIRKTYVIICDLRKTQSTCGKKTELPQKKEKVKPFKCSTCLMPFQFRSQLIDHEEIHDPFRYECIVCHKSYNQSRQLKAHRASSECPQSVSDLSPVIPSKAIEKAVTFICYACNVSDMRGADKKQKRATKIKKQTCQHCNEENYLCPWCSKAFRQCSQVCGHMKQHSSKVISSRVKNDIYHVEKNLEPLQENKGNGQNLSSMNLSATTPYHGLSVKIESVSLNTTCSPDKMASLALLYEEAPCELREFFNGDETSLPFDGVRMD